MIEQAILMAEIIEEVMKLDDEMASIHSMPNNMGGACIAQMIVKIDKLKKKLNI